MLNVETYRNKSNNIRLATINVRSIKIKVEQIIKTGSLEKTDFTILNETWLKDTDEDRVWIATSRLDNNEYQLQTINRSTRQGGWVALLHMKECQTTRIENSPLFDTIEYSAWATTVRNRKITLLEVYHPPIGSTSGNTHIKFLDEVHQLVQYLITNHKNPILLGDFNIHVQDLANPDSLVYNDTMEAMGLFHYIIEPTHQLGNTLDLI